jgi:hypothetical protein
LDLLIQCSELWAKQRQSGCDAKGFSGL